MTEQRPLSFLADSGNLVQDGFPNLLTPEMPVIGQCEPMRFVAQVLKQLERG